MIILIYRIRRTFPKPPKNSFDRGTLFRKSVYLLYDGGGSNVLTKQGLRQMKNIEDSLINVKGFDKFCQVGSRLWILSKTDTSM